MNSSRRVAEMIRAVAREKKVAIGVMLQDLNLSINTLSYMANSYPKVDIIAKIADYLDCSVDYLLGREDAMYERETVIYNHKGKLVKTRLEKGQMEFLDSFITSLTEEHFFEI